MNHYNTKKNKKKKGNYDMNQRYCKIKNILKIKKFK